MGAAHGRYMWPGEAEWLAHAHRCYMEPEHVLNWYLLVFYNFGVTYVPTVHAHTHTHSCTHNHTLTLTLTHTHTHTHTHTQSTCIHTHYEQWTK